MHQQKAVYRVILGWQGFDSHIIRAGQNHALAEQKLRRFQTQSGNGIPISQIAIAQMLIKSGADQHRCPWLYHCALAASVAVISSRVMT